MKTLQEDLIDIEGALIRERIDARLSQEEIRLTGMFPENSIFIYQHETGYWNISSSMDRSAPLGGQSFKCILWAGSPYSRAGQFNGFRVNSIVVNDVTLFEASENDFDLSLIPSPSEKDIDVAGGYMENDLALFDPNAGEVLHSGLTKPTDLVSLGHELSHGKQDRANRHAIETSYKEFRRILNEKSFAEDRLENGRDLTANEIEVFLRIKNYQITENDMVYISTVLAEEQRADKDFLNWLGIHPEVFPNDKGLGEVRIYLSKMLATYITAAQSIGLDKFINAQEIEKILSLTNF